MEDEEALSAYGMGKRGSQSHPLFAAPLSSGRTGPGCGRAESGTAWLPAPLVWTWVRAHRQLLAGNAGLRPATTSIPSYPACGKAWVMLMQHPCQERLRSHPFSALHMQEQWFCAHAETRSALTQVVSQKWRKLHCRLLDNVPETKQSQASAQRRRCGESARAFAVAFRRKVRRARSA
jgi:hypothetical protein